MRRFFLRALNPFTTQKAERELMREIEAHLALLQDDFERKGLAPGEARLAARRAYGGVEQAKELHRETRGFPWLDHLLKDLRFGFRNLRKNPTFTIVAVLTLALGIGANTAIFSVLDAVLFRPLPYADSNRLVTLLNYGTGPIANANYLDWRDQMHSFDSIAAASYWSPNLTRDDPPEHLYGLQVTQNLLPMLGSKPLLGRLFVPREDRLAANHEVILSQRLWQRRFRSDPAILGRTITLDGEAYTVIGVMPADFKFPPFWATRTELWIPDPVGADPQNRGGNHLRIFAHLRKGVSLRQARAEVAAVTARLERQYPGTNRNVEVTPLKQNVIGNVETPLLFTLGAVAFVLLITCANVAHMMLARSADREREIAVRSALGASRGRVLTQFLTESLLLALLGSAAGLAVAFWLIKILVRLAPAFLPRIETITIDAHAILFLLGVSLLTALLFGLAPAVQAAAANISGGLKEGGRSETGSVRRNRFRSFLVASEFALAFMLVVGAGLMVRSFIALQSDNPGFNPHNVVSMVVSVAGTKESPTGPRALFYDQLLESVRALPGVVAAGGINHLPLAGDLWGWDFLIKGRPRPRPGELPNAVYRLVTPGYFKTMRLPLLSGRDVAQSDDTRAPGVVIINQRAADVYWPGANPIGQRITFNTGPNEKPVWLTIIGISADAKQDDWVSKPGPEVYLAARQNADFLGAAATHSSYITLVVRTSGDPAALIAPAKKAVWSLDRNLPISEVLIMDRVVADSTALQRLELFLFTAFGVLALVLAAVGAYGVISYSVARRVREIGIRISLGATRAELLRMLLADGLSNALRGTVVGLLGALVLSRFMGTLLFGVKPTDPMTYFGAAVVLGITALLAVSIPAHKATRVEPMSALRTE
ncbi:MAG TPA: ABC transporter permease [Bryobacteraceae bacterium]|jgi:putative ABC transport system permease protein|nr:ABC transporter permease [Bryobacteraceae bacterium]